MRIVSILLALFAGLAGLLVSVCGGGFLVSMSFSTISSLLQPSSLLHQTFIQAALNALPILMFAATCAVVGGWVFWRCIRFIRREWRGRN